MAAHAQAAHNGQYNTHSAGNESQLVYFHPHQPPQHLQHLQHLQQQQGHAPQSHSTSQPQPQPDGANAPNRHTSFIGLPPISRASTFSSLLRPFQVEGSAGDNNSTYSDAADTTPRNSVQYQGGSPQRQGEQIVGQTVSETVPMATNQSVGGVPPHSQFTTQTPSPGQFIQNMYRPTQGPAQGQMQFQGQPTLPNDLSSPPTNGSVPGQSPVQTPPGQHGPPGNQQGQPGSAPAGAPGAPLPATDGGAPPMAPQFTPANGGPPVMMPPPHLAGRFPQGNWNLQESHLSEPLQPTNRHRHSSSNASQQPFYGFDKETGVPASPRSQRAPDTRDQQPADQNGQHPQPNGQEDAGNLTGQRPLSLTTVDTDDLPAPGPIPAADGNRGRRNSGLFSSLRNRVGAGTPVTSDAVSDASFMTDETGGQQQRRAQMFNVLGAGGATEAPQSKESIIAHGSTTPVNGGIQSPPPQHHQQHQVKKSIMGLKAMFSRSSQQQQDASRPSGNAQSPRPPTQGQGQPHHQGQVYPPVAMSGANPMSPLRPKTSGQVPPQQHQSLASIAEAEKARKPSGGIFGMFKNKDAKPAPSTGPGQKIMDPRQTLQGMGRGQKPNQTPGQGQFPQQQQQYRQQFPVGPDGKLVIFPGQLPPQHQQFMQHGHPGMQQMQQMQQIHMQGQALGQQRPQVNMQQPQPSLQGQNGGLKNQPQQQYQQQQQFDTRQAIPNGQNRAPTGPVSPPSASPAPSGAQSATDQSRPQQTTPPAANGQAPPAATNGGHARTFSQGSNLPSMYTLGGVNGNQPNQLPARKPVGSRVVSAQIPPSLAPQQQQQRQRGASVSSTQPPQTQSPPSTQPPSSLGSQRPSDSQHTLASQGGKSLPDVPTSTQRADQESPGAQGEQNQGLGRQQQPQPQSMQTSPQNIGQGTPIQNVPPPSQPLPRATTMGPGFPVQQQQQQQQQQAPRPHQPSPGFPPRNVMTTAPPPKEKEQSTISKLFRGTKQQNSPTTPQEKGKSSFMSALKRGGNANKQGEAQPKSPAQSPQASQGQFQPNQQPQRQPGLQPPQTQLPGQPQQQQQQQQESRPGLGERRPSPHLQYQNERQDPSKAPSRPIQADLTTRPPGQPSSQQQPPRPPVTSAPGAAAPNQPRPPPQMVQQTQPALPQGQLGPIAPGLVQGQRPGVPGQPLHPNPMAGQAHAQAFAAQQQLFHAQAQAHAQAQMFQRFQQQQAQLAAAAAAQGQPPRPGQPPTTHGQNPAAAASAPPGQEPRYAQVPIPAGYFPVHQGMAGQTPSPMGMPMPYFINIPGQPPQGYYMLPPGQMLPPGMPGMPQMLPPGFVPGQSPFMYAPHPGAPMPPPGAGAPPGTMAPVAAGTPGSVVTMATPASAGTPTPFFTPPTSLGGPQQQQMFHVPVQNPSSPPPGSEHSVQHPPSISPTPPPFIGAARQPEASDASSPQPRLQQQFQQPPPQPSPSPANYPIPNTPFSPVNPDAASVPNPPLPVSEPQQQSNPGLIPQRQVSQVSTMSLQPSNGSPSMNVISPISNNSGVTQIPDGGGAGQGQGHQQLSRSGSATIPSPDSRTVSPEPPVNVAQRLLSLRIDEDNGGVDDTDKDSIKKGDDHQDDHHHWNNGTATTDTTDSRAVSPEPLLTMMDDGHVVGPMTPPPTTVSFIRAQAQEVHVHRSPDRQHVGENNIYDATPRQSVKSPVLQQRRDSFGEGENGRTEEQDFSVKKVDGGLADIREESPENGNGHFIVAAPPVNDADDVPKPPQAPVANGEAHHVNDVGSKKDEKEQLAIQRKVEHIAHQQQQPHIADVMIVSVDDTAHQQPSEQQKNTSQSSEQQPQPQPQQEPAAPPPPAQQQPQQQPQISPEPSPSTSPEPSKSQPQPQPTSTENGVITTASAFPPVDPNPKGILKPLTDRSIFEEAKRKQLLREQEEKIPVFADDDNLNGGSGSIGNDKKKDDEDAVPMMSATSYPGQEWNPYDWGMGMGMGMGAAGGEWDD